MKRTQSNVRMNRRKKRTLPLWLAAYRWINNDFISYASILSYFRIQKKRHNYYRIRHQWLRRNTRRGAHPPENRTRGDFPLQISGLKIIFAESKLLTFYFCRHFPIASNFSMIPTTHTSMRNISKKKKMERSSCSHPGGCDPFFIILR